MTALFDFLRAEPLAAAVVFTLAWGALAVVTVLVLDCVARRRGGE